MRATDTDVGGVRTRGSGAPHAWSTSSSGAAEDATPKLILIAEDEAPIADAIAMIVEDVGYTPLVAEHGEEALELARSRRPDLIITDLMMPRLDGVALISAIREDAMRDGHRAPPIILMTAAGMRRAQEVGADAVVRTPFNVEDLEMLIRRFLG